MCCTSDSCCGPRSGYSRRGFAREAQGLGWEHYARRGGGFEGPGGGGFGVRRPLRFLAYKLELDERQVAELARVLDELKTERAQAEVDDRRTLAEFADAVAGEAFDTSKATAGGDRRVASSSRLRDALIRALNQIHAILNPDQRARFAYLLRTGMISM